jgi:hypothetical protein
MLRNIVRELRPSRIFDPIWSVHSVGTSRTRNPARCRQ